MYICDLDHIAERQKRAGATIIDFRTARAAILVGRCKGPSREARALIGALLNVGATALPVWIHPIDDEIGIEWDARPRRSDLLLAERISRWLGYRTGTHAVGNGGFTFLSVAA